MNPNIPHFAEAARQFCDYVESAHTLDLNERLVIGAALIAQVYGWALRLPDAPPPAEELPSPANPPKATTWRGYGDLTLYWQVNDPYDWGAPQNCSLSEDVLAVHWEVKRGLLAYDAQHLDGAVWQWRSTFPQWGMRAANALRALHRAMQIDSQP